RFVELVDQIAFDRGGWFERRHARRVQDLVGVRVADTRDGGLATQHTFDLRAARAAEDAGERVTGEGRFEWVRAETSDAGHVGRIPHHVHGESLLRTSLGDVEA